MKSLQPISQQGKLECGWAAEWDTRENGGRNYPGGGLLTLSSQKVIKIAVALISVGTDITVSWEDSSSEHPVSRGRGVLDPRKSSPEEHQAGN